MWRSLSSLAALYLLLVDQCSAYRTHATRAARPSVVGTSTSLFSEIPPTVTASMGSDALIRPEDENSPEFKEYLRQLLLMQSSRARAGFSAPSSGSTNAYLAKLNRVKLEQQARRKVGLSDEVDLSYKEEDYRMAMYVM